MLILTEVRKYGDEKFRPNSVPTEFRGQPTADATFRNEGKTRVHTHNVNGTDYLEAAEQLPEQSPALQAGGGLRARLEVRRQKLGHVVLTRQIHYSLVTTFSGKNMLFLF
jgi:hypothetical protein